MNEIIPADSSALESVILQGDLSKLNSEQRGQYVAKICTMMGLNPLTKPFEFMTLSGKLVCYAGKNCAEQLRNIHKVSLKIVSKEKIDDIYLVTCEAAMPNGRIDSATGAVSLKGQSGDMLANSMMKCETKAKRRVTLSILGLGMLDEMEVDSIPSSAKGAVGIGKVFGDQPGETDGVKDPYEDYVVPGGKYVKRHLWEIDPKALADYIYYIEGKIKASPKKPITPWWNDFIVRAEGYLGDLENEPIEIERNSEDFK